MPATPATRTTPGPHSRDRQRALDVLGAVAAGLAGAVLAALVLTRLGADGGVVWRVLALGVAGGALVGGLAQRHLESASFGAANRLTLARGAITIVLLALGGADPSAALAWSAVALALAALALDSFDGRVARARAETSAFGARFDMETDALLILALAALAWQLEKAGAWVLLAGLTRYAFVAAGVALPWLARALPASRRRQTVCVVQIVTLVVCIAPPFARPVSSAVAFFGLALLIASFGADVRWLALARAADR